MKRKLSYFKCAICEKEYNYAILSGVNKHIKLIHNMSEEEYYRKYYEYNDKCIVCGNDTRFIDIRNGFDKFCSGKCKAKYTLKNTPKEILDDRIKRRNQTLFGTEESRNKFIEKIKKGTDRYYNSLTEEEYEERRKQCAYYARKEWDDKTDEEKLAFINKTKELYNNKEYRKRHSEKTSIGTINAYQNMDVDKKKKISENRSKSRRTLFYDKFLDNLKKYTNIVLLDTKEEYINNKTHKYHCNVCNENFISEGLNIQTAECPNCKETTYISIPEKDVLMFIKSIYNGNIEENNRHIIHPKELDIYIPDKKLAIEYNGGYWHSIEVIPNKNYHQEKTLECRNKGIRLIHIFDWEWLFKQEICKSIIKSALGMYDKRIYARQCKVYEINQNTYAEFLEENHLQGSINSSIRYGLYYNNELVAVIGFGKSRFKKDEMELHRFCCKLNYNIIGGFSKLIKHSGVKDFITYVDLAHFTGDGYKQIGFEEISITEPNYKWVKGIKILNRFSTQKHKLSTLLEKYDENLTEDENMSINGYKQVYDSGNIKMIYTLNNSLDTYMEI